jgi:hypothetical protein
VHLNCTLFYRQVQELVCQGLRAGARGSVEGAEFHPKAYASHPAGQRQTASEGN